MKAATVRQHNMDARKKGVLANVVKLTAAWKDMYKINKLWAVCREVNYSRDTVKIRCSSSRDNRNIMDVTGSRTARTDSRALIFKLLRSPVSIPIQSIVPAYVAWLAGTIILFLLGSWPPSAEKTATFNRDTSNIRESSSNRNSQLEHWQQSGGQQQKQLP